MDTGATHHFFTKSSTPSLSNVHLVADGIRVLLPNNAVIESTHKANINIPTLPPAATTAHLFPSLASGNLLSVGQLCDYGCTAQIDKDTATISFQNHPILRGTRNPNTKLWHLNNTSSTATSPTSPSVNASIGTPSTAARIRFYHAALFSPPLSTLTQAIRSGFLATFPGLDLKSVTKPPPPRVRGNHQGPHECAAQQASFNTKTIHHSPSYIQRRQVPSHQDSSNLRVLFRGNR